MDTLEKYTRDEIARGRIWLAASEELALLKGIAAILLDLCTDERDSAEGRLEVDGMSLWALSVFTEKTYKSLDQKMRAVEDRVTKIWPDKPALIDQAMTDPAKAEELRRGIDKWLGRSRPKRKARPKPAAAAPPANAAPAAA
jgi:hypothetical protein